MPFTIPLTAKQRATYIAVQQEANASQQRASVYLQALMDSAEDMPTQFRGITLTDAGLVLGDVAPGPLSPPLSPPVAEPVSASP